MLISLTLLRKPFAALIKLARSKWWNKNTILWSRIKPEYLYIHKRMNKSILDHGYLSWRKIRMVISWKTKLDAVSVLVLLPSTRSKNPWIRILPPSFFSITSKIVSPMMRRSTPWWKLITQTPECLGLGCMTWRCWNILALWFKRHCHVYCLSSTLLLRFQTLLRDLTCSRDFSTSRPVIKSQPESKKLLCHSYTKYYTLQQ